MRGKGRRLEQRQRPRRGLSNDYPMRTAFMLNAIITDNNVEQGRTQHQRAGTTDNQVAHKEPYTS